MFRPFFSSSPILSAISTNNHFVTFDTLLKHSSVFMRYFSAYLHRNCRKTDLFCGKIDLFCRTFEVVSREGWEIVGVKRRPTVALFAEFRTENGIMGIYFYRLVKKINQDAWAVHGELLNLQRVFYSGGPLRCPAYFIFFEKQTDI